MHAVAGNKLRVGILGCSDIACRRFIPALLKSQNATLTAIARREPERLTSFDPSTGMKWLRYQDIISAPFVDLVYISLPNHLHEEWVIRSLQQGKHVLCEKPLGLSAESVNRMLDAADRSGRLLFENLMYLQHPQHALVKNSMHSGKIGTVRSLRAVFTIPELPESNFRMNPAMGGGAFNDLNRYPFSAALFFLTGKKHHVVRGAVACKSTLNLSLDGESITDAGEQFTFEMAFGRPYQSRYVIGGDAGFIRVERAFTTPAELENMVIVHSRGHDDVHYVPPCDHFLATIDHVCSLIRTGSFDQVHSNTRLLGALAETIYTSCAGESGQVLST